MATNRKPMLPAEFIDWVMSLSKARAVARDPEAYSNEELDAALTTIVEDDRLSEAQVTRMQAKIDPVLRARITKAGA
jgi:hypothetical protein